MELISAQPPIKINFNWKLFFKTVFIWILSAILWILLICGSIIFILNYFRLIYLQGLFDKDVFVYSMYLVIATYFFLILDKEKVYEAFGIKRNIPYITLEAIKKEDLKTCQE